MALGVVLSLLVVVGAAREAFAAWCIDAGVVDGPRACDYLDTDPDAGCPHMDPESGNMTGSWYADFNTYQESTEYLYSLDAVIDVGDYLELIPLGESYNMPLSIDSTPPPMPTGHDLIAARITADAWDAEQNKPAVLLICGVHAHEWIPQEVCLGLVDYFVKAANGEAPYTADTVEIQDLLLEREIWVLVNANPAGRDKDDIGTDDGADRTGTYNQRKNVQWADDFVCADEWEDQDGAGRCGDDVRWPGGPQTGNWDKTGINLDVAFSTGWGDGSDYRFGRDLITKTNPGSFTLAPEQFNCDADDNACVSQFGPEFSSCLRYFKDGNQHYGCFVHDPADPATGPFPADTTGLNDCRSYLANVVDAFSLPTKRNACLLTETAPATYEYVVWECGDDPTIVSHPGVYEQDVHVVGDPDLPISAPNQDNPNLLQYCHRGVLQSCVQDADCGGTNDVGPDDYDVDIPFGSDLMSPPHWMTQAQINDQIYCTQAGNVRERSYFCSVDGRRSCGAATYGGQRPFEAIEARLIRELVNNVPFSIVVDMHSTRSDLLYICSKTGMGNGCCTPSTPGCVSTDTSRLDGAAMHAQAATVYDIEADNYWDSHYVYHATTPFPDFMYLLDNGVTKSAAGLPPAWTAGQTEAQGDPLSSVEHATRNNFDVGTVRAITSFQWELGTRPKNQIADLDFYQIVTGCDEAAKGSKPRSRLAVETQLYGARHMVRYLASQAKIPNVAHDNDPVSPTNLVSPRHDLALLGLRIHDAHGRGVQQTEARWHEIDADTSAKILIPAGRWYVSFDYAAGGDPLLDIDGVLHVAAEKLGAGSPDALVSGLIVSEPPGTRDTVTAVFDFEAGETYTLQAWNSQGLDLSDNDTTANDGLVSRVQVVDCLDDAAIPNGLDGDEFCQRGLPFPDLGFECHDINGTGVCRECWLEGTEYSGCDWGEICEDGLCVDPGDCAVGQTEDEIEGNPDGPLTFSGAGTHYIQRTLHLNDGSVDIDRVLLEIDEGEEGAYWLYVWVRNDCWEGTDPDEPMDELEVLAELGSALDSSSYEVLANWGPGDPEGWVHPHREYGQEVLLTEAEVAGLLSERPLRISVRNQDLDDAVYPEDGDLVPESLQYTLMVMLVRTYIPPIPPTQFTAIDPWVLVVPYTSASISEEPGSLATFAPHDFGFDNQLGQDYLFFFRPDDPFGDLARTTNMLLLDKDENVARDAAGIVVGYSSEVDGGRAVSLVDLPAENGPYTVRMQNDGQRIEGSVYLCPDDARDCYWHEPARDGCGGSDCGAEELCCYDLGRETAGCRDVLIDDYNCGGCGNVCDWDETCVEGVCAGGRARRCRNTECPEGTWCCPGTWWGGDPSCKALRDDNDNCGWCGHSCPEHKICSNGVCRRKRRLPCDSECPEGTSCCWVFGFEACVHTDCNPFQCGSCGTVCEAGSLCQEGTCVPWWEVIDPCLFGRKNCGPGDEIDCVDLADDDENCGACGLSCTDDAECIDGVCIAPVVHTLPEEEP